MLHHPDSNYDLQRYEIVKTSQQTHIQSRNNPDIFETVNINYELPFLTFLITFYSDLLYHTIGRWTYRLTLCNNKSCRCCTSMVLLNWITIILTAAIVMYHGKYCQETIPNIITMNNNAFGNEKSVWINQVNEEIRLFCFVFAVSFVFGWFL